MSAHKSSFSMPLSAIVPLLPSHELGPCWASLFRSYSDKGVLRNAFPTKVLPGYFPQLLVDLPVEGEP